MVEGNDLSGETFYTCKVCQVDICPTCHDKRDRIVPTKDSQSFIDDE